MARWSHLGLLCLALQLVRLFAVLLALVANLLHPLRKKPEALLVLGPLPFEFRPAGLLWVVGRRRKKGGGGGCKDSAVRHSKPKSGQAMRLSQGNRP